MAASTAELCEYYITPVGCKLVRGEVSPNGWCSFFHAGTAQYLASPQNR